MGDKKTVRRRNGFRLLLLYLILEVQVKNIDVSKIRELKTFPT